MKLVKALATSPLPALCNDKKMRLQVSSKWICYYSYHERLYLGELCVCPCGYNFGCHFGFFIRIDSGYKFLHLVCYTPWWTEPLSGYYIISLPLTGSDIKLYRLIT